MTSRLARLTSFRFDRPKTTGVIAVAAAAAFIAWLALGHNGSSSTKTTAIPPTTAPATTPTTPARPPSAPVGPISLTAGGLKAAAATLGQRVYWAGPAKGMHYGLTRNAKGEVFLRYLPRGTSARATKQLLTVGTYPLQNAYEVTHSVENEDGAVARRLPGGWYAVYRSSRPTNVYVARPGVAYQIEVFDPSPAKARRIAFRTRLAPVR